MNIPEEDKVCPDYYVSGGLEARKVIKAFDLNWNLGNVVKYILRAGRKESRIRDLQKAMDYLKFELEDEN